VVCHNPERAEGDATVRSNLIAHLRHLIDGSDAWTARKRDELVGSLKTKLGLRRSKAGLLRIEHGAAKREEHLDGKWLLRTSDVTLTPQNLAAAYQQLLAVERGWRDMKGALGCAPCSTTAKTVSAATLVKVWSGHQFEKVQELGVGEWRRASQSSLSGTPARLHLEHHHQRPRCGGDYFTRRNPDKAKSPIIDQLRTIEYDVTLTPRRLSSPQQQ
jgi:hypothetical protein